MISVVLLMAGNGSRMKEDINKVLLPLGNKKVYQYPLDLFLKYHFEVVCVCKDSDIPELCKEMPDVVKTARGGKTRQESVLNGLKACTGDYVLIHDAARALISEDVIKQIVESVNMDEAILVCKPVKDTIKSVSNNKLVTLDRNNLIAAETPQCAPKSVFLNAYLAAEKSGFTATDDISLIEKYYPNMKIKLIPGNEGNFKITTPIDYKLAQYIVGAHND